jgi:hypothetical protein
MTAREYPRIVDATHKPKWAKLRIQHPKNAPDWTCCCCPAPATHSVYVQVDWFRGNDEGPFKACKTHKGDALALLAAPSRASLHARRLELKKKVGAA